MSLNDRLKALAEGFVVLLLLGVIVTACKPGANEIHPTPEPKLTPIATTSSKRTLGDFDFLQLGVSYEDVVAQAGEPDRNVGSGVYLFQYDIADGQIVTLQFFSLDELTGAWIFQEGKPPVPLLEGSQ